MIISFLTPPPPAPLVVITLTQEEARKVQLQLEPLHYRGVLGGILFTLYDKLRNQLYTQPAAKDVS